MNMKSFNSKTPERGSSTALIFAGVFLLAMSCIFGFYGCSKEKSKSAGVNSRVHDPSPETTHTSSNSTPTVTTSAEAETPKKKKSAAKRQPTVSYNDGNYGVSFRYPRKYTLMTPVKAEQNSK